MILVTKALNQIDELQDLLIQEKLEFVLFPAFEIKKITNKNVTKYYDITIFISSNAVIYAKDYLDSITSNSKKIFAVGPETAKTLNNYNIKTDLYPKKQPSSEKLLELANYKSMQNKKILIVRGKGGLETLKNSLKVNNEVEYLEVYDRIPLDLTNLHVESIKKFFNSEKNIAWINSNQTLLNTLFMITKIDQSYTKRFKETPLVVMSDRIAKYALSLGFDKVYINTDVRDLKIFKKLL